MGKKATGRQTNNWNQVFWVSSRETVEPITAAIGILNQTQHTPSDPSFFIALPLIVRAPESKPYDLQYV